MTQAFEQNLSEAPAVIPATRIAVLATGDPGMSYTMLRQAILRDGGTMISVDDSQAFRSMRRVARTEGLSVEPASAVAFAGLEKLLALGHIRPDETVVINCSGHTFPAEKHILEDQYVLDLELGRSADAPPDEGLGAALVRLDEQITKVVVIDDNPHDSRLIRRLLQANKNYRVFEAHDPLDGLDLVRQRQPDLVICDLTMPEMDGFTLLEQLKEDPNLSHIPIMILSGKSLSLEEKARLEGRIESVWTKGDFETQDLFEHVLNTLKDEPNPAIGKTSKSIKSTNPLETQTDYDAASPHILIVDDNPHDSRLLKRILEAEKKYKVSEAHTGAAALMDLHRHPATLVILDLNLPDMGGFDVLDALHHDSELAGTRVAIVSARDLNEGEKKRLQNAVFWPKATLDRRVLVREVEKQLQDWLMQKTASANGSPEPRMQ